MKRKKRTIQSIVPLSMLACFRSHSPQYRLPPDDLRFRGTEVWNWIPANEFWIVRCKIQIVSLVTCTVHTKKSSRNSAVIKRQNQCATCLTLITNQT